jgi:hypothetical protein
MIQNRKTFSWCWQSQSENPPTKLSAYAYAGFNRHFAPSACCHQSCYSIGYGSVAIIGKRRRINYCNHYLHQSCCITCVLSRIQQIHRFVTLCANENVVINESIIFLISFNN